MIAAIGPIIGWTMLATLVVGVVGSLFQTRFALAIPVSLGLFVLSWWFPAEAPTPESARLHPFPVTLLLFILTLLGVTATTIVGYIVRLFWSALPRNRGGRNVNHDPDVA